VWLCDCNIFCPFSMFTALILFEERSVLILRYFGTVVSSFVATTCLYIPPLTDCDSVQYIVHIFSGST
jgi:hypothetical protein